MTHFTDALIEELELNEDLTPLEKMQALNRGEHRNVKAMSDEKLRMNQKICLDHDLLYALNIIESRMLEKGLIKIMTAEKDIAFSENTYVNHVADGVNYIMPLLVRDDITIEEIIRQLSSRCDTIRQIRYAIFCFFILALTDSKLDGKKLIDYLIKSFDLQKSEISSLIDSLVNNDSFIDDLLEEIKDFYDSKSPSKPDNLEENIEKHDKLNPALFDEDKHLFPDVREALLRIAKEFVSGVEEDDVAINVADIKLVGSNCSYNYNQDSDIDLHIVAETKSLNDPNDLYPVVYNLYKSAWNNKYEPTIKGIPVELYVETEASEEIREHISKNPLVSNGIYSVLNDKWIKEPELVNIPEVDQEEIEKALAPWLVRFNDIMKNPSIDKIDDFMNELFKARQESITIEGEYNPTNHAFKSLRAAGHLDEIRELRRKLKEKEMSLDEELRANGYLTDKELQECRAQLQRVVFYQPIIQRNGLFSIYQVPESDVHSIERRLRNLDCVDWVNSTPGAYDFGHFTAGGVPSRKYTINGKVKVD